MAQNHTRHAEPRNAGARNGSNGTNGKRPPGRPRSEESRQPAGAIWTIYTLLAVWAGDIFAYFVGKSLGRHRMSPEISPKKTWEGAVASILASVIVGTLWIQHAPGISSALL